MALAATEVLLTVPFAAYEIYANAAGGRVAPWKGWSDTHYHFSKVILYPAILWKADPTIAVSLQLAQWLIPTCALVFLAYFGFAQEARKRYVSAYKTIMSKISFSGNARKSFSRERCALL